MNGSVYGTINKTAESDWQTVTSPFYPFYTPGLLFSHVIINAHGEKAFIDIQVRKNKNAMTPGRRRFRIVTIENIVMILHSSLFDCYVLKSERFRYLNSSDKDTYDDSVIMNAPI